MSNPKELRKQIRNVVQEILPEVLTKELENELFKILETRISKLEADVKQTMQDMNKRHKDVMSYLVGQATQVPKIKG